MGIKIKTKLYAGLGFLAFLVMLLWGSGLLFINTLADNSSAIIRNNIRTVTYMENMEQAMNVLHLKQAAALNDTASAVLNSRPVDSLKQQLTQELDLQLKNITETGEAELSSQLKQAIQEYFMQLEQLRDNSSPNIKLYSSMTRQYGRIQDFLAQITYMNLDAINRKNNRAQKTASQVILYMTIMGGISTLLALGLLIRYPSYIVNPIRELIDRIKKIANQNYDQRLEFNTGDEYEELAQAFNTMAKRLKEYDSSNLVRLMNEKQRIEAIIDNMHEGIIGLDREKNILFINAKAEELIGIDRDKLVGQYAPDIASTNDFLRKLISELMDRRDDEEEKNQVDKPNIVKVTSGDRNIYYSKEIIPVMMDIEDRESEQKIGTIITLKNVTHFQEMNEAKTNFISVVSHELKTPISSINMSLRLLEDKRIGSLNEEQADLIDSIRNETNRMKQTTAELLDLTQIETGNIQLNTQKVNPLNLIEYAYETMIMQANQKDISLEIICKDNISKVKADIQKTVWVLVNLISNAIRYTPPEGYIKLNAEELPRVVRFSVSDSGKGIPEKYLDKIFQKYFQVHSDLDGSGGTGLGLAIAKEFINAQGGNIGVESEREIGSTFYFTLPKVKSLGQSDRYET